MLIAAAKRLTSGALWLDEILHGGFLARRSCLIRGGPGTGKTTMGLLFLTAGVMRGESSLLITLGEPEAQVRQDAGQRGFDLNGVSILDLSPTPQFFAELQGYEIFSPAEVEREPITRKIIEHVERTKPTRVFVDPLSQLRYLSQDAFQFRRQVLSFLHFLQDQGATVLFTSESSESDPDDYIQVVGDGIITLENKDTARTLCVSKFRGSDYEPGKHSLRLTNQGMEVYPRLVPADYGKPFDPVCIPFGIPVLDQMLSGGLERGTITIITGPSGIGKTSLGIQFLHEAASRGERSVVYTFEEEVEIMLRRSEALQIPARRMIDEGHLAITKIEPLRYSADEFARLIRTEVEEKSARIVMIDSMAGYRLSLQGEGLVSHLHALCKYLQNMGVAVLLINEIEGIGGEFKVTEHSISYLADNVIFFRYMEHHTEQGLQLAKAIGVLKKRLSPFDSSIREFALTEEGICIGAPLIGLTSILSTFPVWMEV